MDREDILDNRLDDLCVKMSALQTDVGWIKQNLEKSANRHEWWFRLIVGVTCTNVASMIAAVLAWAANRGGQ